MLIQVRNQCDRYEDYRSNRCRSMFNATYEQGATFHRDFELPIEDRDWNIGVVVGPSGTGKSSVGRQIWGPEYIENGPGQPHEWSETKAIIDGFPGDLEDQVVTATLKAVGLPPETWLRPYPALSNGEQFRASVARWLATKQKVVIDEFTSVVDRAVAEKVSRAFARLWPGPGRQAVLLTCHHDVLDWALPDWILDTNTGRFVWRLDTHPDEIAEMGRLTGPEGKPLGELVA